jgi:predicted amino acid racemase
VAETQKQEQLKGILEKYPAKNMHNGDQMAFFYNAQIHHWLSKVKSTLAESFLKRDDVVHKLCRTRQNETSCYRKFKGPWHFKGIQHIVYNITIQHHYNKKA